MMGGMQHGDRGRRQFLAITTAAFVLLIPWTILLAYNLPDHHTSTHWELSWVGFDVAEILSLARTAWLAFRRRPTLALWTAISGTLLVCDTWFDLTTASGNELVEAIILAAVAEVPLVIVLFTATHRLVRAAAAARPLASVKE
jgi:hypothetical protein